MKKLTFIMGLSLIAIMTGCVNKNDTAVVTVKEKDGLINTDGEVQIKPIYKKMYKFDEINRNTYDHPNYVNMHWLHVGEEQYAVVKNIDNKYGIIGKNGELKLKVIFDSIGHFFNGYAKIEVDNKFGLIDENFEIVVKPIYDDVRSTIDGVTIVKNYKKNMRDQYGCLNSKMELVATLDYDMIYLSNEKRMRVEKDGLWGFMDTNCNITSAVQYKYVEDYSNGMAKVQKDTLWTYVDLDGKEIERRTFESGTNF
ncbi:MAG: WG repeat-containing protein [Campylobacterota bacterium]|nr:WG repeat-containing protein [Campylobacterota bacterium]